MARIARPTKMKILYDGEKHKRRINLKEPQPEKGIPVCPRWLPKESKLIWKREAQALYKAGIITRVDGPVFVTYCLLRVLQKKAWMELSDSKDDFKLTRDAFTKSGKINEVARPQITIFNNCTTQLLSILARMGMTPSDRSKIILQDSDHPDPKEDEFEKFLSQKRFN